MCLYFVQNSKAYMCDVRTKDGKSCAHFEFGKKSGDKSARRTSPASKGAPRGALSSITNGQGWLRSGVPAIGDGVSGSLPRNLYIEITVLAAQ